MLSPFQILLLFLLLLSGLVLLLFFVLLIRGHGHIHLQLNLWAVGIHDRVAKDLIREESFVQDLVVGSWALEELIIDVRILGWIDSNIVATALVLSNSFPDILLVTDSCCLLHRLN